MTLRACSSEYRLALALAPPAASENNQLDRLDDIAPTVRPAAEMDMLVLLRNLVVDLIAVRHQHVTLAYARVQQRRRLCAA